MHANILLILIIIDVEKYFFKLHQYYKAMAWVRSTLHKRVSLSLPFNSHPYIFPTLVRDGSGYQNG